VAARAELVIATQAPSPRALPAAELAARTGAGAIEPDCHRAVAQARARGATVVVFGSLFLVGPVRARLLGEREDPIAAQDPPR
jgi:folylpolyglutamate synthase/dihydropteroate synthase